METSDLYELAAAHHHQVDSLPLKESVSFCVQLEDGCHIALSSDLCGASEKTILAHELGHCEYGGFYNYHSPYDIRSRSEARANRWAFRNIMPLSEVNKAIAEGDDNPYLLAERFGVTVEFVRKALAYYDMIVA